MLQLLVSFTANLGSEEHRRRGLFQIPRIGLLTQGSEQ